MQQRWMLYSAGTTTSQHLRTFYGNYNHTRTVWMCAHTWLNAERINSLSWAWRGTASGHRWPTGAHHLRSGAFNRAAVTANEADLLHSFFFFCIQISQRHHLKSVVYVSLSSHHVHVRQSVGRFDYSNDVSSDVFTQSTWNFSHCKTDSKESSSYYSCGSFATVFFFYNWLKPSLETCECIIESPSIFLLDWPWTKAWVFKWMMHGLLQL